MVSSVLSKVAVAASTTALFAASLASAEGAWFSFLKDCPQTCSSSGVSSANWTAYHDTKSLVRCKEPMLLDFAIHNPIDDPTKRLTLFACAGPATGDDTTCDLGSESSAVVQSAWSGRNDGADADSVLHAAQQAVSHLSKADCSTTEPTTAFGYLNGSFVGVYSGGQMHNQGAIDRSSSSTASRRAGRRAISRSCRSVVPTELPTTLSGLPRLTRARLAISQVSPQFRRLS